MVKQEQWSSTVGFVAAAVGSAVGLGNIWRFPYITGINGGGAFLIAYLAALLLCALPMLVLELTAGRRFRTGVTGAFRELHSAAGWLGALIALLAFALLSYYLVVAGWALGYLAHGIGDQYPQFQEFTAEWHSVTFFLAALLLTAATVLLGVQRGIEAVSKALMPVLFLILLGLAVYGAVLPGWQTAMTFYLAPDLGALLDGRVWVYAFGQVFFSLGVGMGVMITYGSYLHATQSIPRAAVTITIADNLAAFLAGMVIFPIVFSVGGEPGAGPQLAFDTMPLAFMAFPGRTGQALATLFYALLSIAAITSAVSLLETARHALSDLTGIGRRKALGVLTPLLVVAGLPSALSYAAPSFTIVGRPVLDVMDELVGTIGLSCAVLVTAVVLGWLGRAHKLDEAVGHPLAGRVSLGLVRFVVPAAIGISLLSMVRT